MKNALFLTVSLSTGVLSCAFAPNLEKAHSRTALYAASWQDDIKRAATGAFVAATLWGTGFNTIAPDVSNYISNDLILSSTTTTTTTTTSISSKLLSPPAAYAKEMASGSGSRVNKDPESLLRYGLPINSKEVRKLQVVIEDIKYDLGSKRKNAALDGAKKARSILTNKDFDKIKAACRDASTCSSIAQDMIAQIDPLSNAVKDSLDSFQGSEQERQALDRAYVAQEKLVDLLTQLEEQMVPAGYKTPVPEEYSDLPQLQGRAVVEMTFSKPDKSSFVVGGQTYSEAKMTMVIDGYASPVTGGNFVDLVQKGFYNKMPIQRSDGFVVQTGDPPGDAVGYVGTGSKSIGNGKYGERLIPLEIFVRGDKAPIYETTMEDEGRGGEATILPFSSYGAMGWARDEFEPNSGGSQFFWLLFDSDLTPAGKNVLDGRYPCFGYVVKGADFLGDIKEGDIITSAKVTSGGENLILPRTE